MIEQAIGATINATTMPAMKVEDVYTVEVASGSCRVTPCTLKIGIQPNQSEIHRDRLMTRHCRKNAPHRPKTTLGIAAIRSMMEISRRRRPRGAYSEM